MAAAADAAAGRKGTVRAGRMKLQCRAYVRNVAPSRFFLFFLFFVAAVCVCVAYLLDARVERSCSSPPMSRETLEGAISRSSPRPRLRSGLASAGEPCRSCRTTHTSGVATRHPRMGVRYNTLRLCLICSFPGKVVERLFPASRTLDARTCVSSLSPLSPPMISRGGDGIGDVDALAGSADPSSTSAGGPQLDPACEVALKTPQKKHLPKSQQGVGQSGRCRSV